MMMLSRSRGREASCHEYKSVSWLRRWIKYAGKPIHPSRWYFFDGFTKTLLTQSQNGMLKRLTKWQLKCLVPIQEYMNTLISSQTWRNGQWTQSVVLTEKNLKISWLACYVSLYILDDDGSQVVKVVKTRSLPDLKETLSFHLQVGSWGSWLGVVQLIDRPVPPLCFHTLLPILSAIALYHDQVAGIGLAVWRRSQPTEFLHRNSYKVFFRHSWICKRTFEGR